VRYDDADGIEETTFRFASKYSPSSMDTNFFFQYGEGFKLPSFFALGHPLVGNSALMPEFSKNASLRVEKNFFENRLGLAATYFYNQFSNLVDFDPILFTNVNRSKVVAKGGELELIYSPDNIVRTSVYVTYTDYWVDTGETLRRRPDLTGGISVLWEPNKTYSLGFHANYVSSFYDSSIPTGLIEMDGYTKVDVTIGWQVTSEVNLKFITNNIFNNGFEETVGFSNPGREFRLILKVSL
jgi:iron complex outermembrane receptor protein/vitamin B12 transporter